MGNIITAVAVLEIHMERKPVATIKPRTIFLALVPNREITYNAILLCKFQRSIAIASKNPPRYRKIILFPNAAPVVARSKPPVNGNKTSGSKEVTGIGTASEIHQIAIHTVEARTESASGDIPSYGPVSIIRRKTAGPNINATFFLPGRCFLIKRRSLKDLTKIKYRNSVNLAK